jgi:hypothetical protein
MTTPKNVREETNLPTVNQDFIVVPLTLHAGRDLITATMAAVAAAAAAMGTQTYPAMPKALIVSNDGGATAWIKSEESAAVGKGIVLAANESIFLPIAGRAHDPLWYESTATLSVAVFF